VLVYDGDCTFCRYWVERWQHWTGNRIVSLPYQEPGLFIEFPCLKREHCESAVHLVRPDGTVLSGAAAVYASLGETEHLAWLHRWYRSHRWFARVSELGYSFVARRRSAFSRLQRFLHRLMSTPFA